MVEITVKKKNASLDDADELRTAARRRKSLHASNAEQQSCSRPLRLSLKNARGLGSLPQRFHRGHRNDHALHEYAWFGACWLANDATHAESGSVTVLSVPY